MSLDHKGGVDIPKKYRKALENAEITHLQISKEFEDNIGYLALKPFKVNQDNFIENGYPEIIRAGKRITIPKEFRDYADLTDKVAILGILERIELWNTEKFREYLESNHFNFDENYDLLIEMNLYPPNSI